MVYGGDLRTNGFTELLLEVVARHHAEEDDPVRFENVLAWPVHMAMTFEALAANAELFAPAGALILLDEDGAEMTMMDRSRLADAPVSPSQWGLPLTGYEADTRRALRRQNSRRRRYGGLQGRHAGRGRRGPALARGGEAHVRHRRPGRLRSGHRTAMRPGERARGTDHGLARPGAVLGARGHAEPWSRPGRGESAGVPSLRRGDAGPAAEGASKLHSSAGRNRSPWVHNAPAKQTGSEYEARKCPSAPQTGLSCRWLWSTADRQAQLRSSPRESKPSLQHRHTWPASAERLP